MPYLLQKASDLVWRAIMIALTHIERVVSRDNYLRKKVSKHLFLWDAREFLRANEMKGSYYEFGVYAGATLTKAMSILEPYIDVFYGFDSFRGLPPFRDGDHHPGWHEGHMNPAVDGAELTRRLAAKFPGARNKIRLVEGFFEDTLPDFEVEAQSANVLFVDADLTSSLTTVFDFVRERRLLQDGTLVYLDDFFTYRGNPGKGAQKAFAEFRARVPGFVFEPYHTYPPFGKAFIASELPHGNDQ